MISRSKEDIVSRNFLLNAAEGGLWVAGATLASAIANAENNNRLKPETLRIKEAVAGTAATIKRFTPKARGSAGPILKRSCHIKIILSDQ